MNRPLTADEAVRALELLDVIVKPSEHERDMFDAVREAQRLLGYPLWGSPVRKRSFYGIRKPTK